VFPCSYVVTTTNDSAYIDEYQDCSERHLLARLLRGYILCDLVQGILTLVKVSL